MMRTRWVIELLAITLLVCLTVGNGNIAHAVDHGYQNGIDVSHYQNDATMNATGEDINWNQVRQAGINFAFVLATDGQAGNRTADTNYDSMYVSNMQNGHAAGLRIGPYHYAEPVLNINDSQDAIKEANWFVGMAYPFDKNYQSYGLPPALDLENDYCQGLISHHWTSTNITRWVLTWMHVVENRTGLSPILYTSASCFTTTFFDMKDHLYGKLVTQYGIWVARYDSIEVSHPPSSLHGAFENWNVNWGTRVSNNTWTTWNYWQYSSKGSVNGITGNVDLDYAAVMDPVPITTPVSQQVDSSSPISSWFRIGSFIDFAFVGLVVTLVVGISLKPVLDRMSSFWILRKKNDWH